VIESSFNPTSQLLLLRFLTIRGGIVKKRVRLPCNCVEIAKLPEPLVLWETNGYTRDRRLPHELLHQSQMSTATERR
jgi:hypothetical protein